MATPQQIFNQAIQLHQSGRINEAIALYNSVLPELQNNAQLIYLLGTAYLQKGQHELGVEHLQRAIYLNPNNASAHFNLGIAFQNMECMDKALVSFDHALELKQEHAEAHYYRGNTLKHLNQPHEALTSYDQALKFKPDYAKAYNNRGVVLQELNQHDKALESLDHALKLKPDYAEALYNRGISLSKLNRPSEALYCYEQALKLNPDYAKCHCERGTVLQLLNHPREALASLDQALELQPDYEEAHYNRGNVLQELNLLDAALASYDQALKIKPDYAEAYNNRGVVLQELNRPDEALASHDQALKLKPDYAEAYNNRGAVLRELSHHDEALASYDQALKIKPDYAEAHSNRGVVLQELNCLDEALASYDRALKIKPDYAEAYWNKSLLLILTGQYSSGWELYEWRIKHKDIKHKHYTFDQPAWRGQADIHGKKILIYGEQGLGDVIQFCRYLPQVAALGAEVIAEVPRPLVSLVASLGESIRVIEKGNALPDFDFYCPLASLPYAFNTTLETIPSNTPYLSCAPGKITQWKTRLGEASSLRVGLAWSGREAHNNDHNRSIPLEFIEHLLDLPVEWHSLQKEYRSQDSAALARHPNLIQHQNDLNDFSDTAALIQCLDLVISVDTSVAHVAGALGKPVWLLLPFAPDYRWLLQREDSPWYPTARLFRQQEIGNWLGVLSDVKQALRLLLLVPIDARDEINDSGTHHPFKAKPNNGFRSDDLSQHNPTNSTQSNSREDNMATPQLIFNQALQLHQSGRINEAIVLYNSVLPKLKNNAQLFYFLGTAYLQIGQQTQGVEHLRRALVLNPNNASAHNNFGIALQNMGRLDEALASFDHALKLKPNYPDALNNRGNVLRELNRPDEALASYDQALKLKPDYAEAHSNRGVVLQDLNRLDEALASYDQALKLKPDYAEAHNNRGLVIQELNRLDEALASYDQALKLKPDYAEAHNNRGNALKDLNRLDEALASYDQALKIKPDYADAHYNRGISLRGLNRPDEALASYDQALKLKPDYAEACNNRGNALKDLNRPDEALASYDQALKLKPDYAESHNNRGNALKDLNRPDEALASYDQALKLKPDFADAHSNRGVVLQELNRLDEAMASYDQALKLKPDFADAHSNRGVVLQELNRPDEALASYDQALKLKPDYAEAHNNRGLVIQELNRLDEALASYDQALKLKPDYAEAYWNKSLLLILTGQYSSGWELYEWRIKHKDIKKKHYTFDQPTWRGQEDIHSKKILIYGEQGFGDVIQFCRYLPQVAALGAEVIAEVPRPLVSLVASLGESIRVIEKGNALPDFDVYCPLMSLPYVFNTTLETIPSNTPYLSCAPEKLTQWKTRLGEASSLRVGLAWSGREAHNNDHNRSIPLEFIEHLLDLPVEWHSLQKEYRSQDSAALARHPNLLQHQNDLNDFSDTAALIQCLDLVISVDTSVAHVAGALGKPVWLLLPFAPDYRWLLEREDSPWYPTARLFRQQEIGNWLGVLSDVEQALRLLLRVE